MDEPPSLDERRIALRTSMRYASKLAPVVVSQDAVRRPGLVARSTVYDGVIVDERVLTKVFPWLTRPSRLSTIAVRRGTIEYAGGVAREGDVLLLPPELAAAMRFEGTSFVELEWMSPRADAYREVAALGHVHPGEIERLASAISDPEVPGRRVLASAIGLGRALGAPLEGFDAAAFEPVVTARDEQLATALCGMLSNLATAADTFHLGEGAALSPRQLQRVLVKLGDTFGLGVTTWRDLRNRWRLQVAAVLLGRPELDVAAIAVEVGYASGPALARAFAKAGFPPPLEVRRRLLEARP